MKDSGGCQCIVCARALPPDCLADAGETFMDVALGAATEVLLPVKTQLTAIEAGRAALEHGYMLIAVLKQITPRVFEPGADMLCPMAVVAETNRNVQVACSP